MSGTAWPACLSTPRMFHRQTAHSNVLLLSGISLHSPQVAVARLVAGVFARVAARSLAEEGFTRQLAALQQRIDMLAAMQSATVRSSALQQEPMQRRLVNAAIAVACTGAGVMGAYAIIRRVK